MAIAMALAATRRLCKKLRPQQQRMFDLNPTPSAFACRHRSSALSDIVTTSTCPFQHSANCDKTVTTKDETAVPTAEMAPKSFLEMPTPKGLPFIGTTLDLIKSGGAPRIHEYCDRRHRKLGPIYRERLGETEAVFVADSEYIQRVYQKEGKFPMHFVPEPWTIYNETTGIQRGLFFMDGPIWNQRRLSLNKVFLKKQTVSDYAGVFNNVITELLQRWYIRRDNNCVLQDLEKELYNWSIESLGTMIFGRRLGCIQLTEEREGMHEFVQCVQHIFTESAKMTTIPPRLAYMLNLPVWRRFVRAAGRALQLAREYVEENVREIASKAGTSQTVEGVLSQLLLEEEICEDEIVRIVTDLFLAAADTTSHATQWTLYLLAKNQECQSRLLDEVERVVPRGEIITEEHLSKLPYVKSAIKEALRLYPVAPFLTRILSEDFVLGGYEIPSGKLILMSLYTTGRDPKYFPEPEQFRPERWIRNKVNKDIINTHACLPFGLGSRSCIGRRVAEIQMQFLIARTVQLFRLENSNQRDVSIKMRMITTPNEPITLRLIPRNQ